MDERTRTTLLYNSSTPLEHAIQLAYKLGHKDVQTEVATDLQNTVLDAYRKSEDLPWPPSADYLANLKYVLPAELEAFLMPVLGGGVKKFVH